MKKVSPALLAVCCAIFFVLLAHSNHAQQRPVVSQYMYNGFVLNPAYAGSNNVFSSSFLHRDQWINFDGAPSFQTFTAHTPLYGNRVGVGLIATRDEAGAHIDHGFYSAYSYKMKTSRGYLAMGMQGGFNSRVSDYSRLNIKDKDDPPLTGVDRKVSPNFGTGLYYYNRKMYFGVSVPYILKNNVYATNSIDSDERAPRYYYATGGIVLPISQKVNVLPSVLVRYTDQSPLGIDLNCNVVFDDVVYTGFSYRSGDSFTLLMQLVLNENFRIGYAYDVITSDIRVASNGSHEFLLNYRIRIKSLSKDPLCPVYF